MKQKIYEIIKLKNMKKKSFGLLIGSVIIGSAIIWGAVILGCSIALKGTECYSQIQIALVGGVTAHLIFIWGPIGIIFKKIKDIKTEEIVKE